MSSPPQPHDDHHPLDESPTDIDHHFIDMMSNDGTIATMNTADIDDRLRIAEKDLEMQNIPLVDYDNSTNNNNNNAENDDDDDDDDAGGLYYGDKDRNRRQSLLLRTKQRNTMPSSVAASRSDGNRVNRNGRRRNAFMSHSDDNDFDEDDESDHQMRDYNEHESLLRADMGQSTLMVNITNLDEFFSLVYQYFQEKGFWCIFFSRVLRLATVLFMIVFSTFLLVMIDWFALWYCNGEACKNASFIFIPKSLDDLNIYRVTVLVFETVFLCFWIVLLILSVYQVAAMIKIKNFYNHDLGISEGDVQTITWSELVEKIVQIQRERPGSISRVKTLDEWDIANLIMRKDNYLIAFINKDILNLRIPLPFIGHEHILSESLLFNLRYVISLMFDNDYNIRDDFIRNPNELRWKFIYLGVLNLIAAPFVFVFLVVYLLFKYAAEIRLGGLGTTFLDRRWSTYARYRFKEFNELNHIFEARMKRSIHPAKNYLQQFPYYLLSTIAQTVMFFASACIAVIVAMTFIKSDLLVFTSFFNQNLVWWLSLLILVFTNAKSLVIEENQTFDPNHYINALVKETHYLPPHWMGKGHHMRVLGEFQELFQPNIILLLKELSSIVITPLILCFSLANSAENVCKFVDQVTTEMEAIGHVCGFATFDAVRYGDERYGSDEMPITPVSPIAEMTSMEEGITGQSSAAGVGADTAVEPTERQQQQQHRKKKRRIKAQYGKMEKSLLNFMVHNPKWKPHESTGAQGLVQKLTESAMQQTLVQQQQQQQQLGEFGRLVQSMSPSSSFMVTTDSQQLHPNSFAMLASSMHQAQLQQQLANAQNTMLTDGMSSFDGQQQQQQRQTPATLQDQSSSFLSGSINAQHGSEIEVQPQDEENTNEELQVPSQEDNSPERSMLSPATIASQSMLQSADYFDMLESYYQARSK